MNSADFRIAEHPPAPDHRPAPDLLALLLDADPSEEAVREYVPRSHLLLAHPVESPATLAGVLALLPTRPLTAEIVNVAVHPDYRRRGLAVRLIRRAEELCRAQGAHTLEVCTGSVSFDALALYQKAGFRVQSVDSDYFVRRYPGPLYENGIELRDMLRLSRELDV